MHSELQKTFNARREWLPTGIDGRKRQPPLIKPHNQQERTVNEDYYKKEVFFEMATALGRRLTRHGSVAPVQRLFCYSNLLGLWEEDECDTFSPSKGPQKAVRFIFSGCFVHLFRGIDCLYNQITGFSRGLVVFNVRGGAAADQFYSSDFVSLFNSRG